MGAWTVLAAASGGTKLAAVVALWRLIDRWTPTQARLGLVIGLCLAPLWLAAWETVAGCWPVPVEALLFEWHLPLAALTFAWLCAARLAPPMWLRRPLLLVGWGLLIWPLAVFWGPVAIQTPFIRLSHDRAMSWQSTWWSCGPAAAASLTDGELSEHAAALACATRPWLGTLPSGLAAGLRQAGLPVRIIWFADSAVVRRQQAPCLVYVRIYQRVIHIAELLSADERGVALHDPSRGRIDLTWDEFEAEWLRVAVVTD